MEKVVIVGGGAAGIFAAIGAKQLGAPVTIIEKNNKLGIKLLITGKGRCNLTNIGEIDDLIASFPGNGPFLYSAFYTFSNRDLITFFESIGVPVKVERGGRVFPQSDRAKDVMQALIAYLTNRGVQIVLNTAVEGIKAENNRVTGYVAGGKFYPAQALIIATGGLSYPRTGSTGDGYRFAQSLGHQITPLEPSLVPLEVKEQWAKELAGLSLKNVKVTARDANNRTIAEEFGEMLFTHFGVSGPIILTLSRFVVPVLRNTGEWVKLELNLKPALDREKLDARIQRDLNKYSRKQFKNALGDLLPKALIEPVIGLSGIVPEKFCHQITKEERRTLGELLQQLPLTVTGARPITEAIVTSGGISVKEINPASMESKLIKGLYFAGEVLDIDAYTGGYNLQAAFSTGYVAGQAAAKHLGYC
ncbi:NAD(P)/FAD-dependent oxidoreductase [Zhaonella formicivorans]|uniref:NAD(P)/FAD-dependent oxidoreductase n=1 Tax=Zhaonella formicivorans TaxID=2528593 RepID=UPI0010E87C9D|nr:NAD(P)/FAD-dependent oxidoreductase [Zhaonella formicivorans]